MRALWPAVLALLLAGCLLGGPATEPTIGYPRAILSEAPYAELVVEVFYAPGNVPSDAARAHLLATLGNVTRKADITWDANEAAELGDPGRPWDLRADLVPLGAKLSQHEHGQPAAVLTVLYPGGRSEDADAAGITLSPGGPSVVFLDKLRELSFDPALPPLSGMNPDAAVTNMERAVLLHEVGHAIGLVNLGLPMARPHEASDAPGHSANPRSVMTASIESLSGLRQMLIELGAPDPQGMSIPDTFDPDDLADLKAGGGR